MKISLALAGTALLAGSLTACGGSSGSGGGAGDGGSGSDYCKDLKTTAAKLGSLENPDLANFDSAVASIRKLAAEAPGSIKGDWKTLDGAVAAIEKAFADAGLKLSDLKAGSTPSNLDPTKLASLTAQLTKFNTPEFTKASNDITAHAKKTCKVTLK